MSAERKRALYVWISETAYKKIKMKAIDKMKSMAQIIEETV